MDELKNNSVIEDNNEDAIIEIQGEDGNKYYFVEELVFPVGEDKYVSLVSIDGDECDCCCEEEHIHDEECDCDEEDKVILAKIVKDENGEVEYINPTDEEFEIAQKAYEELMNELEVDE